MPISIDFLKQFCYSNSVIQPMDEDKKQYELSLLISPNLSEEEVNSKIDEIKRWASENGEILFVGKQNKIRLAYPVSKNSHATFASFAFTLDPNKISALEKKLKQENSILRHLITIYEKSEPLQIRPRLRPTPMPIPETRTDSPESMPSVEEIDKRLEEIIK